MHPAKRNIFVIKHDKTFSPIDIIIPIAGIGYRMLAHGPKPLIKLGKKTLIDRQLKIIDKALVNYTIILVIGHEKEKILKGTPKTLLKVVNPDYAITNVSTSLKIGLESSTKDNVLVIMGDLVFNKEALSYKFDNESLLILDHNSLIQKKDVEVGCIVQDGFVESMNYNSKEKWGQIAHFTGKELGLLKDLTNNPKNNMKFTWELINQIIDLGGKFRAICPKGIKVYDIDSTPDISKAMEIFNL
jgi:choline kinase